MPSKYAHYRFGVQLLPKLPPDAQRTVRRFRQLYDMGLHGPDIFFYHNPVLQTNVKKLGRKFHYQTGKQFFEHACRSLRMNPSEGAMAYLYGVLAHYALDSLSHPFIIRNAEQGKVTHAQIELEFDRYLLEQDGKKPPYLQDLSGHMQLTPGQCRTVAGFYPNVSAGTVGKCVENMASITRFLVIPKGPRRDIMAKAMGVAGRSDFLMPIHPNRDCTELNPSLLRLYEMAMDRYPILFEQIHAHLSGKAPLGADFSVIFG
jgi:hypothetical protein